MTKTELTMTGHELDSFSATTLQEVAELPEHSVRGLRLRRVEAGGKGIKGNARVRYGKRWLAQRFVLLPAGSGLRLAESRCSCGEADCLHLARVLSSAAYTRALHELAAEGQPTKVQPTPPEPASKPAKGKKAKAAAQSGAAPAPDAKIQPQGSAAKSKSAKAAGEKVTGKRVKGQVTRAEARGRQGKGYYGPLLQNLRRAAPPRRGQTVRYRLNLIPDPEGGPPLVSVGAEQARYTRAGVLLPELALALPPAGSPEWRRGWLDTLPPGTDADRELLRGLADFGSLAHLNDQPVQILRRETLTDHLLAALLATGRLYAGADAQPLAPGVARPLRYGWPQRRGGVQVFELRPPSGLDEGQVFTLGSRWYLDREAGRLGEVTSPLPADLEEALLAMPPIAPEQAAATRLLLAEQLHSRLGPAARTIPLPQALAEQAEVAPYQPAIVLQEAEILAGRGKHRQPQRVAVAALHHEYAGVQLDLLDEDAAPQTLYCRDPEAEAEAARGLMGAGLQPLERLFPPATQPQHEALSSLYGVADPADWYTFLQEARPRLEAQGFRVEVAGNFPYHFAEIEEWYGEASGEGRADWFDLELGVLVGGQRYSLLPLLAGVLEAQPELLDPAALSALPLQRPLLAALPDGRTAALPAGRVRDILGVLVELHQPGGSGAAGARQQRLRLSALDAGRLAELDAALNLHWYGSQDWLHLGERLRSFDGIAPARTPRNLGVRLRPYQRQGLGWLQFLREYGLGGILADDMGLGKTVQTLAHLLAEKNAGRADLPSLVVAPTSVLSNWAAEAERFAPKLRVLRLHGPARHEQFAHLHEYDLILTSYALLPRDIEVLRQQPFHQVILDEAQNIKNPRSQAARAAGALQARHRLALTGTPLENHLGELWSLFHFLMPGLLGSERQFARLYRTPIEKNGDPLRQKALASRIRPFVLRRTKEDVARELPSKTELVVPLELEGDQRDLYETVRVNLEGKVQQELAARGFARSSVTILDALLKLRQAATDPRLLRLSAAKNVRHNAKREWLQEQLPRLVAEGHRILIFSQFASLLNLLEADLQTLGITTSKLTGQTRRREEAIARFQEGEAEVFLISLKAGGVGLNLTAADTVIHLDPWWNPAAEAQATDRAYRIGQDKPVFVYKLVAAGSVEERILEMQARKAALAGSVLDGGLSDVSGLTQDDLDTLLAPLSASE